MTPDTAASGSAQEQVHPTPAEIAEAVAAFDHGVAGHDGEYDDCTQGCHDDPEVEDGN